MATSDRPFLLCLLPLAALSLAACGSSSPSSGAASSGDDSGQPQVPPVLLSTTERLAAQSSASAPGEASDGRAIDDNSPEALGASDSQASDSDAIHLSSQRARCLGSARGLGVTNKTNIHGHLTAAGLLAVLADSAVALDFSAPACSSSKRSRNGVEWLTFDPQTYQASIYAAIAYQHGDREITVTSDDLTKPTYTITASDDQGDADARDISVGLNVHRVISDSNQVVLDIDVLTNDGNQLLVHEQVGMADDGKGPLLTVKGRTIVSGEHTVVHNLVKATSTHAYTNLAWDFTSGCLCPSAGSIKQVATYDSGRVATHTWTFSGCGTASVQSTVSESGTALEGTTAVTWDDCQDSD